MKTSTLYVSPLGGRLLLAATLAIAAATLPAAPQAELWPRWEAHDPSSSRTVNHDEWDAFLEAYLIVDHPSGVDRVPYADVSSADRQALQDYLDRLQAVEVSGLNRDEQIAYWINLYNAATVDLILDNYPVDSIRDLGEGIFSNGPWDDELLTVEGEALTLNDVEHRIVRPIWRDARIHYVVNCASIGCPNLQPVALTAENWDRVFADAAVQYITHPRGVRFDGRRLVLSSIYDWYVADFGGDLAGVKEHVADYLDAATAERLMDHDGRVSYEYDWTLNEP
jgi:hypothetical protein